MPYVLFPQKVWVLTVSRRFRGRGGQFCALVSAVCAGFLLLLSPLAANATTLEIGVEHTEVLPEVSQDLRPGRRFSLSAEDGEQPANEWIRIPHWMSGTWRLNRETAVLRKDFKKNVTDTKPYSYNARHDFQYGMQQDRAGDVWHFIGTPYHSKTSMTEFDEYHLVKSKVFNRSDEQAVTFTTLMTVVRTEYGHQIKESFQSESITSYSPDGEPGYVKLFGSTKSFDASGNALKQTDNVARIKQLKPFSEVRTYHGQDMRERFREFLIARGLTNLLPY
ncbi:hypothetical protein KF913_18785 [Candidatus Obscuribacterales bacterium]|nr:hypothetical protein [Candidatus Obscuribacterales bacterium]